jgi:hypothetical protein
VLAVRLVDRNFSSTGYNFLACPCPVGINRVVHSTPQGLRARLLADLPGWAELRRAPTFGPSQAFRC